VHNIQIALPNSLVLSAEQVDALTGCKAAKQQEVWLKARAWPFDVDAKGRIQIGALYAHLRLAGLHQAPSKAAGFDLTRTR
jgi:Domain of unknown function (DUF4224)